MNIFRTRKFREEKFSDIKSIKVPEEFKVISEREYDKDVKVKSNPQNEFMTALNSRRPYSVANQRQNILFNELSSGKSYLHHKTTNLQNILNMFDEKRKTFKPVKHSENFKSALSFYDNFGAKTKDRVKNYRVPESYFHKLDETFYDFASRNYEKESKAATIPIPPPSISTFKIPLWAGGVADAGVAGSGSRASMGIPSPSVDAPLFTLIDIQNRVKANRAGRASAPPIFTPEQTQFINEVSQQAHQSPESETNSALVVRSAFPESESKTKTSKTKKGNKKEPVTFEIIEEEKKKAEEKAEEIIMPSEAKSAKAVKAAKAANVKPKPWSFGSAPKAQPKADAKDDDATEIPTATTSVKKSAKDSDDVSELTEDLNHADRFRSILRRRSILNADEYVETFKDAAPEIVTIMNTHKTVINTYKYGKQKTPEQLQNDIINHISTNDARGFKLTELLSMMKTFKKNIDSLRRKPSGIKRGTSA